MPINRPVRKLTALVLAGAAVAVAAETGTQGLAAQSGARPAITDNQGNPNAVPPILRAARPSEFVEIRAAEAWDGQELYYDPPASARYSGAVFGAFAK